MVFLFYGTEGVRSYISLPHSISRWRFLSSEIIVWNDTALINRIKFYTPDKDQWVLQNILLLYCSYSNNMG